MPRPDSDAGRNSATDKLRPARPEAPGIALEQCRAWLNWAAAQVEERLASDNLARSQLLAALADVLNPAPTRSGPALGASSDGVVGPMQPDVIQAQAPGRATQGLPPAAHSL